jgi:uncharacterized protein YpmS
MKCPKCGFQQKEGPECLHCGIIFARLHTTESASDMSQKIDRKKSKLLSRFLTAFSLAIFVFLLVALFLIFHTSPAPQIAVTPDDAREAESKVKEFKYSISQGRQEKLQMTESELNGWLSENLMLKRPNAPESDHPQPPDSAVSLAKKASDPSSISDAELEQAQSSIRDVKVELKEDSLKLYAIFELHGVDLSMELDGHIRIQDGYLKLALTGGKLGSFPFPKSSLQSIAERIFDSSQNKEKFKLPPYIKDIQIEGGQLNVTSQ